jgi:hypothetical protein
VPKLDEASKNAAYETTPIPAQKGAASASNPVSASPPPKQREAESEKLPAQKGAASTSNPLPPSPPPTLGGQARITAETATMSQLVPLITPASWASYYHGPKDWQDFCHAANASACIYLPANTTFTLSNASLTGDANYWEDEDPLINDKSVCDYDGGAFEGGGCIFSDLVKYYGDFKPTGAVSPTASCDPPNTYVVDPKGAVKMDGTLSLKQWPFVTGSTSETCVVQVWIYQ